MTLTLIQPGRLLALLLLGTLLQTPAFANEQILNGLDFQRTAQGNAQLILDFSTTPSLPETLQSSSGLRLRFVGAQIQQSLINQYDTSDFATRVTGLLVEQRGRIAEIELRTTGSFDHLINVRGQQLIVEIRHTEQRTASNDQNANRRFQYTGDTISLDYQNIPVRQLLSELARFLDLNLVAGENVQGNITLQLNDVPSDQALDIVLTSQGLASRQQGKVLLVAPAEQLINLERQQLQASQSASDSGPLEDAFIRINYARAADIHAFLMGDQSAPVAAASPALLGLPAAALTPAATGNQSRRFLSERGHLLVDERTNTVYVRDIPEQVRRVRQIIETLDVAVNQVMIEARIVVARSGVSNELGISWGLGSPTGSTGNFNVSNPVVTQNGNRGLSIDFGSNNNAPTAGIGFGYLSNNILLDLELTALETENRSEVISQPKVITSDRVKAIIRSGEEIPYQSTGTDGVVETSFRQAELRLEVTPHIVNSNQMILDLKVNNDSKGEDTFDAGPSINTNAVETQVLVNSGETLVIGGIFTSQQLRAMAKTPLLGDIPLLGWMFRRNFSSSERVELLIFITPRMINNPNATLVQATSLPPAAQPRPASNQPAAATQPAPRPTPAVARASAPQPAAAPAAGNTADWLLRQPPERFTLQLMADTSEQRARDFIRRHNLDNLTLFQGYIENRPWFFVVHGDYATQQEAQAAIRNLPASIQNLKPWARSYRVIQRLMTEPGR